MHANYISILMYILTALQMVHNMVSIFILLLIINPKSSVKTLKELIDLKADVHFSSERGGKSTAQYAPAKREFMSCIVQVGSSI